MTEEKVDQTESGRVGVPENIRRRLGELAQKLEDERRSLDEACLLREAELKAFRVEMEGRETHYRDEKARLEESRVSLKDQCAKWEALHNQWVSSEDGYKKQALQFKEELLACGKRETLLEEEKKGLEDKVRLLETDVQVLSETHRRELQDLKERHKAELEGEIDEFESLLEKAREAVSGKGPAAPPKPPEEIPPRGGKA